MVLVLTICLPKLFMASFDFVDGGQHGGTIVPSKTEQGRIVKHASRRALPARARQLTS
jgi:hypothetical protein